MGKFSKTVDLIPCIAETDQSKSGEYELITNISLSFADSFEVN